MTGRIYPLTRTEIDCAKRNAGAEMHRAGLFEHLMSEFEPVGAAETILVAEIARRLEAMERTSAAAEAWRQFAAESLRDFVVHGSIKAGSNAGLLAENVVCPTVQRAQRISLAHSRAFSRALQQLLRMQEHRIDGALTRGDYAIPTWLSEGACLDYLAGWHRRNFNCRACGNRVAHFIRSRPCLECTACHTQCGLRSGTVMADSPLPLCTWFVAIGCVLRRPSIKTQTLQRILGLRRIGTVRAIIRKIHRALIVDERSQLLAGLDQYFAQPEPSVPFLIDQDSAQALSLATARYPQPNQAELITPTASAAEIRNST